MSTRNAGRGAIRPTKTPTVAGPWDAAAVSRCSGARALRAMHAWVDPDGDPEDPASYRFPHHLVSPDGEVGAACLSQCRDAIRSIAGSGIPESDQEAVHRHLASHLRDGGHTVPEFKSAEHPQRRFERRFYFAKNVQHRAGGGGKRFITGSFALYEVLTELRPGLREKIARGCFAKTIRQDDIVGLFNHDMNMILGRRGVTMTLADGPNSCDYEIEADERQTYTRNLMISIDRGDVTGNSFSFQPEEESGDYDRAADLVTRTLVRATLYDVGPVVFPQYSQTNGTTKTRSCSIGELDIDEIAAAAERLRAGADDPATIALVRSAAQGLQALIPVTGPTPEQRARERARVIELLRAA